ncbi:MAG: DUF3343 domain-containing protein [Clostridiales bacterium]|nr:DUF3343 domain-containing protein [Clostridiales bacterium]
MAARCQHHFVIFGFTTTHAALDAERVLLDLGVPLIPVPAPKGFGALCGIGLRLDVADAVRAAEYLDRAGIEVARSVEVADL